MEFKLKIINNLFKQKNSWKKTNLEMLNSKEVIHLKIYLNKVIKCKNQ